MKHAVILIFVAICALPWAIQPLPAVAGSDIFPHDPLSEPQVELAGSRTELELQIELIPPDSLRLFWNVLPGAMGYRVYYADTPLAVAEPGWTLIAETTDTCYVAESSNRGFYYVHGNFWPGNFVYVQGSTIDWLPRYPYEVTVESFLIDRYEVTCSGYSAVMGTGQTGSTPIMDIGWYDMIEYCNRRSLGEGITPCYSYNDGTDYGTDPSAWPAGWNSTSDNQWYILYDFTATGYRLLLGTEWEYAAMGGIYTHLYTYSGSNNVDEVAWYSVNSGSHAHDVGTKAPNELGIYDMSGNADEFLWDNSGINRKRKGGSWFFYASYCEIYWQAWSNPTAGSGLMMCGFRVCRSLP
jgi:hypothetical protein